MNSNCDPGAFNSVVAQRSTRGSVAVANAVNDEITSNRIQVKIGLKKCAKVQNNQHQQLFYTPRPGYIGMDTIKVLQGAGDAQAVGVVTYIIRVGDN